MKKLKIYCDGASRGNPGLSGIGYLILDPSGKLLREGSEFLGVATNNQAEYYAAIKALEDAIELGAEEVELYTDSELLVKQLRGEYAVRDPKLKILKAKLLSLTSRLSRFEIKQVPREENVKADVLANLSVDEWMRRRGKVLEFSPEAAELAGEVVRAGGVILYPADTFYLIGCDPLNDEAVKRVHEIKRGSRKPYPILVDGVESALKLGIFDEYSLKLVYKFWPGPLTIIVGASKELKGSLALFEGDKVGLLMPSSFQALEIIRKSGGALIGTGANFAGRRAPRSFKEVDEELIGSVELAINGGRCPLRKASTVIEVRDRKIRVLREGQLSLQELKEYVDKLGLSLEI
ncbi:MAG: L-threonylcarbamoyladenylate synthase [Nitrososphaerota archaeon]|nr:L-threonylcarbamoyladenylate synthase [Nitrososphaerota archaeon]